MPSPRPEIIGTASPQAGWVTQTFANYLPVADLARGTVDDGLADELGHIVSEVTAPLKTLALQLADWGAASDIDDMSLQQIVDDLFALIGTATLDVAQHLVEALLALFLNLAVSRTRLVSPTVTPDSGGLSTRSLRL